MVAKLKNKEVVVKTENKKNYTSLYFTLLSRFLQAFEILSLEGMFSFIHMEKKVLCFARKSAAHSARLLFANEVCHEIKLILSQPKLGKLLDAIQAHFYD